MKTAIVYSSNHHENTLKLVKAIAGRYEVELINADENGAPSLEAYDRIGFASGIAYSKMYKVIQEVILACLPEGKEVFFLYTCGKNTKDFSIDAQNEAKKKNCKVLGSYGCAGYDTYGPLKLFGGLNKDHPDANDIEGAVNFYEGLA